jgi:hypothetical protein
MKKQAKMADGGLVEMMQPIMKSLSSNGDFRGLGQALGVDDRFQKLLDKNQAQDGSRPYVRPMKKGGVVRGDGIAIRGKTKGRMV